jgi:mRNA interferase HigB
MHIISKSAISEFIKKHADSEESLIKWYVTFKSSNFHHFHQIHQSFSNVDFLGNDLYVFHLKDNTLTLIARIFFGTQIIQIKFIGTHHQFEKTDLSKL